MTKEALKLALESLEEAADAIDSWGSYASGYFQVKHDLEGDISKAKSAITAIKEALAQPEQEPVAWLHTKIEGVAVPHRPADLDKHPDRWEALYKTPPPCPTCEALARTVMLDQTSHDTTPPQRTWVGLTEDDKVLIKHDANFNKFMTAGEYADRVQQLTEARLKDLNT